MVQNVRLKYQTQRRSFLKRLPNLQETLTIPHLVDGLTNCRNHFCHFSHLGEEIFLQGLKQNFGQMASPARLAAVSLFLFYFSFKEKVPRYGMIMLFQQKASDVEMVFDSSLVFKSYCLLEKCFHHISIGV